MHGTVTVVGSDGIPKSVDVENGNYSLMGLSTGTVKLAVNSPKPGSDVKVAEEIGKRKKEGAKTGPEPPSKLHSSKWFQIPDKYGHPNTSGLSTEIAAGPNRYDIVLKATNER